MPNYRRQERFLQIKRWLGNTFPQKPSPDFLYNQMLVEENKMLMRLTNTRDSRALKEVTLNSVIGQTEYSLPIPSTNQANLGTLFRVKKKTTDSQVPFADVEIRDFVRQNRFNNVQGVEHLSLHSINPSNSSMLVTLSPVPTKSEEYTLYFHTGSIEKFETAWTDIFTIPELCDYLDTKVCIFALGYSQWSEDAEKDMREEERKRNSLMMQLADMEKHVEEYIENQSDNQTFYVGRWNQL